MTRRKTEDGASRAGVRSASFGRSVKFGVIVVVGCVAALCAALVASTDADTKIRIGDVGDVRDLLDNGSPVLYLEELDLYLVTSPQDDTSALGERRDLRRQIETGFIALSASDHGRPGESVSWCNEAAAFTEPNHGSTFDRYGRKSGGPAPTGMSLRALSTRDGVLYVDPNDRIAGADLTVSADPPGSLRSCFQFGVGDARSVMLPIG